MQGLKAFQYEQNRRGGNYERLADNIRTASKRRAFAGEGPFWGIVTSVVKKQIEEGDARSFTE